MCRCRQEVGALDVGMLSRCNCRRYPSNMNPAGWALLLLTRSVDAEVIAGRVLIVDAAGAVRGVADPDGIHRVGRDADHHPRCPAIWRPPGAAHVVVGPRQCAELV